jgi:intergrase/recombinase
MPPCEINAVPINHLRVLQTNNKEKPSYGHTVQFVYTMLMYSGARLPETL